jgi:hypothetical protein
MEKFSFSKKDDSVHKEIKKHLREQELEQLGGKRRTEQTMPDKTKYKRQEKHKGREQQE